MKRQIVLMNRARIKRTLKRMAIQVWEHMADRQELVIIGLNERGYATARELADHLGTHLDRKMEVHRYDVDGTGSQKEIPDCNEKFVLLVDDVIFSGKTMFDAISAVFSINEPERIEVATLLDRGHRKYPVLTTLTGIKVPTKPGEHIEVMLKDGTLDQAVLFKNK